MTASADHAFFVYRGDGSRRDTPTELVSGAAVFDRRRAPYVATDPGLVDAVNVALAVGQPLLVTGEPGVGKTSLAWSVARELGYPEPYEFYTHSTSVGTDVLYRYDALAHFRDVRVENKGEVSVSDYIELEALGRAIAEGDGRAVVLIDEVDKAPTDFPNDLLNEIDEMAFTIKETGETHRAECRPVVIITSNGARPLPHPFLRRCVAYDLRFPDRDTLMAIVGAHFDRDDGGDDRDGEVPTALREAAVDRVLELRETKDLDKPPSTSELLVWLYALHRRGVAAASLRDVEPGALPLLAALIKSRDDLRRVGAI